MSDDISTNKKFPEVGLPGVENDPTPRGIILHPSPASQRPYRQQISNFSQIGPKSAKSPPPIGLGQPPIGADYPSNIRSHPPAPSCGDSDIGVGG